MTPCQDRGTLRPGIHLLVDSSARSAVLLSGRVASGKSRLVQELTKRFPHEHVHVLKTKVLIQELARSRAAKALPAERRAMQDFGDRLDRETSGKWVRDALITLINQYTAME